MIYTPTPHMQLVMQPGIGSLLTNVEVKAADITRSKETTHIQTGITVVTGGSPLLAGRVNKFSTLAAITHHLGEFSMRSRRHFSVIVMAVGLSLCSASASALDASSCGGIAIPWRNTCGNQTAYVHICYPGGKGQRNFPLPPGQNAPGVMVDQGSTQTWAWGTPPSSNCPAPNPVLLERCQ